MCISVPIVFLFCFLHASRCLDITETLDVRFVHFGAHEEFYFLRARSREETLYIYIRSYPVIIAAILVYELQQRHHFTGMLSRFV